MKKRYLALLLLIVACAPIETPRTEAPQPAIEKPAPIAIPLPSISQNVDKYIIKNNIPPFTLASYDAIRDAFGIIPAERYDGRYQSNDVTVLVHVFKFGTREELDFVLNSMFYDLIERGARTHQGQNIALYLTYENTRAAFWTSGMSLIYVDTLIPDFSAKEIMDAYIFRYPSDLPISKCIDSDGNNRFIKGDTTRIKLGDTFMKWTDVCLKDSALYRNKQYVPVKPITEEDGLLEGTCEHDTTRPGKIYEYNCPRGCRDGECI